MLDTHASLIQVIEKYDLIDKNQLAIALSQAQQKQQRLITYLIEQQEISAGILADACAKYFDYPKINLYQYPLTSIPAQLIKKNWLTNLTILPLSPEKTNLPVVFSDPMDFDLIEEIQFYTGLNLQIKIGDYEQLKQLIQSFISYQSYNNFKSKNSYQNSTNPNLAVQLVQQILQDAINLQASDIHCEPMADRYRIRLRVDGILQEITNLDSTLSGSIANRLKTMANLDIAQKRLPQDGRFTFTEDKRSFDCRLSSCPTIHGEKLVIRLLNIEQKIFQLEELGLEPFALQLFIRALSQPQGLILITGPTGSGKTISLYSALQHLNQITHNISTIEEPVEIQIASINQVNVNHKIGLNFATALRAFLRQDPDIIMIGEIRDQETAEIAVRAAQTGHLVLATLHTNNAAEAIIRLINMGIAPFNLAHSITLIIAQRLVRRLCLHCKIIQIHPISTLQESELPLDQDYYSASGCQYCFAGYKGRIGVFELLPISPQMTTLLLQDHTKINLIKQVQQEGVQSLWKAASNKVLAGMTSLTEIYRVINYASFHENKK